MEHGQTDTSDAATPPDTAKGLMIRLAPLLMRNGLQVVAQRNGFVEVRNPSGNRTTDPLGRALNPGMKQQIALGDRDGILFWHWVWSGVTRDAPPEYEPICPADDLDEVARRLAVVLAVAGS